MNDEHRCDICCIELYPLTRFCNVYREGSDCGANICQQCTFTLTRCLNVIDVDFKVFLRKDNSTRAIMVERKADENKKATPDIPVCSVCKDDTDEECIIKLRNPNRTKSICSKCLLVLSTCLQAAEVDFEFVPRFVSRDTPAAIIVKGMRDE